MNKKFLTQNAERRTQNVGRILLLFMTAVMAGLAVLFTVAQPTYAATLDVTVDYTLAYEHKQGQTNPGFSLNGNVRYNSGTAGALEMRCSLTGLIKISEKDANSNTGGQQYFTDTFLLGTTNLWNISQGQTKDFYEYYYCCKIDEGMPLLNFELTYGETYYFNITFIRGYGNEYSITEEYIHADEEPLPPWFPEDPVKEHYDFAGWYLDEELTIPFIGGILTEPIDLYAKWTIKRYTVSFVTNCYLTLDSITVDALTLLNPVGLSRDEADFISWYVDEGLTIPYNPSAPVVDNMTLYAKWSLKMIGVRFIVDGEIYAEFTFPYGTYLSAAKTYIESVTGVSLGLYADAGLTQPFSTTPLREDYTIYGEVVLPVLPHGDEEVPGKTFFEQNWGYFAIGGGIIAAALACIVLIRRAKI